MKFLKKLLSSKEHNLNSSKISDFSEAKYLCSKPDSEEHIKLEIQPIKNSLKENLQAANKKFLYEDKVIQEATQNI